MSTQRRDGAAPGGGQPTGEPGPASAEPTTRRPAVTPVSASSSVESEPASERAPDSYLQVDENDYLPTSSQGPNSAVPTTRRSPLGGDVSPASERSPDSSLELDEKDWLALPPLPLVAKKGPTRGAPPVPPTAPPRKPTVSRPLGYEMAEGGELLRPSSDEQADSGVFSPASRRAPDPWANPSIVPPPPPLGPSLKPVEVYKEPPPPEETPRSGAVEAESSAPDPTNAITLRPAPRVEARPVPRWLFAAVPLVATVAFVLTRFFTAPVPISTAPPVAIESATTATVPATAPPVETAPAPVETSTPAPTASQEAPPPAETTQPPPRPTSETPAHTEPTSRPPGPKSTEERGPKPPVTHAQPAPGVAGDFNRDAAAAALSGALSGAQSCVPAGMGGVARLAVTFAPSGRVTQAMVEGPPFAGTSAGGCIATKARSASVPPFQGGVVTVHKSVRF